MRNMLKQLSRALIVAAVFGLLLPALAKAADDIYFPAAAGQWLTKTPEEAGWNASALQELLNWHAQNNTYSFMMLHNGKIVVEEYWDESGNRITGQNGADKRMYKIYSCGKSITAFLTGLAQEQGKLKISDKVSDSLGQGWTRQFKKKLKLQVLPTRAQEAAIQVQHLIKMSTGLRKNEIKAPDTWWEYNTDAYHLTHDVLQAATGMSLEQWAKSQLLSKIGISGETTKVLPHTFDMNARDMARFGIMILAGGSWNGNIIMKDKNYFTQMLSGSQPMNPAYGYLWWLNGTEFFLASVKDDNGNPMRADRPITKDGPADLICARGKFGQGIYISPSHDLVIVRQGNNANNTQEDVADEGVFEEMWAMIAPVINNDQQNPGEASSNPFIIQPQFAGDDGIAYFDDAHTLPSWLNPEIRIFSVPGNIDVTDTGIHQNANYSMKVKVHNSGLQAAENVTVQGYYCNYGVTSEFKPFGKPVVISSIAPGATVEADIRAKSGIAGHVCVKAEVSCSSDKDLTDNVGQRNLAIESSNPGREVKRTMLVTNQALVKQSRGKWNTEPVSELRLLPEVTISPAKENTPQNQAMVRVEISPAHMTFSDTTTVTSKIARIKVNFDKKLPAGIRVEVKVRPFSKEGKILMDGCTWQFNLLKRQQKRNRGGM